MSVVLVNYRGTDDTIEAVDRLEEVDWDRDRMEIVVVENASGDDSFRRLRGALGDRVILVESDTNRGFAGGCNLGVAHTTGEFVAFLNNDAKPEGQWIRSAMERFAESPSIGLVASKVLDWEGRNVDFVGAALTWYGMGYKPHTGDLPPASAEVATDVLFGTGSAMFVRSEVFDALGGFDESYFMFFEDVDLGWRANLAGYRVAYEPRSVAFHRHHGSMGHLGSYREQFLLERNALYTLYKNLDEPTLLRTLPAAMGLAIRRGITAADLEPSSFEITAKVAGIDDPTAVEVPPIGLAATYAIDQFVENLPRWTMPAVAHRRCERYLIRVSGP